jgi:TusA-related sulfurtransferase
MAMCPMSVTGTAVAASDVTDGEALTFTTDGEVAELRTRVRAMAKIHNEPHAGNAMNGTSMPVSRATVTDVEGGAALSIVTDAAGDVEDLRAAIRASAQRMRRNGCEMMGQTHR